MKKLVKKRDYYATAEQVGELKINLDTLRKHMLIVGSTGQGKSVMLKRIIRQNLKRQEVYMRHKPDIRNKQKMIIHDIKGDFIEEFYTNDKEWIILNPFDKRGYGFEVMELISMTTDIDRVVNSIIKKNPEEKDPIWTNMSRSILKGIIGLCIDRKEFSNKHILKYIDMGWKKLYFETTTKEAFINEDGEEKFRRIPKKGTEDAFPYLSASETQAANYWSSFTSNMNFFKSFISSENIINIRDYIRNDPRNIILANFAEVEDKISPILALFIECLSSEILALEENTEYEISLILDEFNSLDKMPKVLELLKLARSKGGIVIIGVQEIPPIKEKYGEASVATFKNNTRTKIIFNINDDETQKIIVSMLGKQELIYTTDSNTGGETETKDGFSSSQQRQVREAVLDSAIAGLREHEFFYIQSGISDEKKNYVGKITGMIDHKIDKRDKISTKILWKDELEIQAIKEHIKRKKENVFDLNISNEMITKAREDEKKVQEEKKKKEEIMREEVKKKALIRLKKKREETCEREKNDKFLENDGNDDSFF